MMAGDQVRMLSPIIPLNFTVLDDTLDRGGHAQNSIRTDKPDGRSGHRCVTDGIHLYCYGGYNPAFENANTVIMDQQNVNDGIETAYPLFRELWRFNIATRKWTLMPTRKGFPSCLASHSSVISSGNYMLVFGGTAFPFGEMNDKDLHICQLSTGQWAKIPVQGDAIEGGYGQAVYLYGKYMYIFGGTAGTVFNAQLHSIDVFSGKSTRLSTVQDMPEGSRKGRYRSEMIVYNDSIYIFGGGRQDAETQQQEHLGFKQIDVFSLRDSMWTTVKTIPDKIRNKKIFPFPRKCHTCVLYRQYVYMCGGMNENKAFGDIWRLDLHTLQWTRMVGSIEKNIFFHSAVLTHSCCMVMYGGVQRPSQQLSQQRRCSTVWEYWLDVPPLRELAWRGLLALLASRPDVTATADTLLRVGVPRDLLARLHAPPQPAA